MNDRPLLIVLTPVRNEAWILHAFLKATSLWADYIIIADQMSTDGSRDIYSQYEKVILVDNPRTEMHQARTRQLLFEAAKKIEGDKILFALDADEFLSGDFVNTPSWQLILNSKPGDVFCFRWMNLLPNLTQYQKHKYIPFYWIGNLSDNDLNLGYFPDNHIHEPRLPWPVKLNIEYILDDIHLIHFARVNERRQKNKEIFYQVSTVYKEDKYSGIKLFRHYQTYKPIIAKDIESVPDDMYLYYLKHGVDIIKEIKFNDEGLYYVTEVDKMLKSKDLRLFAKLDIWSDDFLKQHNIKNPQSLVDKLVTIYLRATKKYHDSYLVKCVDWLLKRIY